jgi:hypothetical protein
MHTSLRFIVPISLLAAALSGCGGGGSSGASPGASTSATGTTTGTTPAPASTAQLVMAAASYTVAPSSGSVTILVNRTDSSTGVSAANYATVNGTAVAGVDYAPAAGTLTWDSGDATPKAITVSIATNDTGNRDFGVQLASPVNATLGATASATVTITAAPPAPPPPTDFWVYYNGAFAWPGDYSFNAAVNYKDTSAGPLSGVYDIAVNVNGAYGAFQPYATNWAFDSSPYTKLTFALKPTVANQQWQIYFMKVGDVPVGITLNVLNYGPAPVVGQWSVYTIPMADLGVLGTSIYKFAIQDQTGLSNNVWYVDNIGFLP